MGQRDSTLQFDAEDKVWFLRHLQDRLEACQVLLAHSELEKVTEVLLRMRAGASAMNLKACSEQLQRAHEALQEKDSAGCQASMDEVGKLIEELAVQWGKKALQAEKLATTSASP
jgi:hypothetical protein